MPKISSIRCRAYHTRLQQLLVEVETDDGLVGVGEAWWGIAGGDNPGSTFLPIQAAVEHLLAPRCIGRDANAIEGLWFDLADWSARYGDGGIVLMALSGIDLALWDLLGKRLNAPVLQLIGGAAHERIRAYASLPPLRTLDAVVHECRRAQSAGFNAFKLHEIDAEIVNRTRDALGADAVLMVDVNGHFDTVDAIAFGHSIAGSNILWYEEPVRPMQNHDAIARVAQAVPIDLAAGENEYSLADFSSLLQSEAIRFLQPEITKCGGLTQARKISALSELHNIALSPHNFRIGPSLYASIHWGFSSPATRWLEMPWLPEGSSFPCGAILPPIADGYVLAPEGPGFGI